MVPSWEEVVAIVFRSYIRIVVEGGRNEKTPAATTPVVTRMNLVGRNAYEFKSSRRMKVAYLRQATSNPIPCEPGIMMC
jgi:ribosomal protein L19